MIAFLLVLVIIEYLILGRKINDGLWRLLDIFLVVSCSFSNHYSTDHFLFVECHEITSRRAWPARKKDTDCHINLTF